MSNVPYHDRIGLLYEDWQEKAGDSTAIDTVNLNWKGV
jgi:hypothetical protein